jgi:hypothetical protein
MIKIDFEFDTKHGKFKDALNLPDNHTYSDAEIQAMKEQRRDNWINLIENPLPPDPSQAPPEIPMSVEVEGETYQLLTGVPLPGAKLIQVEGSWYWRI